MVQGEAFCGRLDNHMPEECDRLVEELIPVAMPVLADLLVEQAPNICPQIAGVC